MNLRQPKLLLSAFILLSVSGAHAANPLKIKTDKGKVEGVFTADQKVIAFKGIPFAAPPVGNLRWQPPQQSGRASSTRTTSATTASRPSAIPT
jgi:para-nitrobenzyl esterase